MHILSRVFFLALLGLTASWSGITPGNGTVDTRIGTHPYERTIASASRVDVSVSGVLNPDTGVPPGVQSLRLAQRTADRNEDRPDSNWDVEQTWHGHRPPAELVTSFDGLGDGFEGPQGSAVLRNPSDNSLAVGPDHIIQTVNSRTAIFSKKGSRYEATGQILYGPAETRNVFRGFGGPCEEYNNGDAVIRYDQLADRWLLVMPIFRRLPHRQDEPSIPQASDDPVISTVGRPGQPYGATRLHIPPKPTPEAEALADSLRRARRSSNPEEGSFAMCYAVSTGPDPFASWYRYEFVRPLFPDYPRPAVWPDGYYVPSSTGDNIVQKHTCVAERKKMLEGLPAREVCFVVDDVNFLNNADLDGFEVPPTGAPNIVLATGGTQLAGDFRDNGIYFWEMYTDWEQPELSRLEGPGKITVAPYAYLCDGQLTRCVPQPGTDQRIDSQGDKLMARVVYRRIGDQESLVAVHSIATPNGGGGVRWYEFRLDPSRKPTLFQQGTYAPGGDYRWMASPAMDRAGNIGIGYSFGGESDYPGQRFAGRLDGDSLGVLTLQEHVLVEGEAAQTTTLRWEDYTQTAVDPDDDCTIWYVGDYLRSGSSQYSTRIGAFRMPGCPTEN